MSLASPYLGDRDGGRRYQRTVHGWVDVPREDTFSMTVRIVDPGVGIELTAETTTSPEYAIRAARGRVLVGEADRIGPDLGDAMAGLAGLTMTSGFGRAVRAVAGARAGAGYFVDAAIEVARLARQVTRLPDSVVARHRADGQTGLAAKPVPGRPRFLTDDQERPVHGWLAEKPTAHGFRADLWTARRVTGIGRG